MVIDHVRIMTSLHFHIALLWTIVFMLCAFHDLTTLCSDRLRTLCNKLVGSLNYLVLGECPNATNKSPSIIIPPWPSFFEVMLRSNFTYDNQILWYLSTFIVIIIFVPISLYHFLYCQSFQIEICYLKQDSVHSPMASAYTILATDDCLYARQFDELHISTFWHKIQSINGKRT